jgi:drug/metabolite transporter (DMT)-like permease
MDAFLLLLPFIVLISWTASNTMIKNGLKDANPKSVALIVVGVGLIPITLFVLPSYMQIPNLELILFGIITGILLGSGFLLFYSGLNVDSLSSTGVTLNIQQVLVIIIAVYILGESTTLIQATGIVLIVAGALSVSAKIPPIRRKFLLVAGLANISWGIYYLPLSLSINLIHLGSVPLFLGRLMGLFLVLPFAFLGRKENENKIPKKSLILIIMAGFFDGLGNVFYSISIQTGIFVLAGSIVAMLPATLAVAGFFLYKDRMNYSKILGIALSVIGALIVSLG